MDLRIIPLLAAAGLAGSALAQDVYELFEVDASLSSRLSAAPAPGSVYCQTSVLEQHLQEMDRLVKQGNSLRASAWGGSLASSAAACALADRKAGSPRNDPRFLALVAGEGLAVSVLTNDPTLNPATEARAKAYLTYSAETHPRAASTLKQIEALHPPVPARAEKAASLRKGATAPLTGVVAKGLMRNIALQSCKLS